MTARLLTFLLLVGGAADAAEPRREQFAFEAPIAMREAASVFRVPLTPEVYRGATRSDLGDLRVFNAAGEVVPHALTRSRGDAVKTLRKLPLFPVAVSPAQAPADVSVDVEVATDGSIIKVSSNNAATASRRVIYLLDASAIGEPISALEFEWRDRQTQNVVRQLNIEVSDDLKNWRPHARGVLTRLMHEGSLLERRRIEFPRLRAKYLRAQWAEPATSADIVAVTAELTSQPAPERAWMGLVDQGGSDAGERLFRADSIIAADRVRVLLPANSVMRVRLLYRDKDGDPWRQAATETVYHLKTPEGVLKDDEIRLPYEINARQWLLRSSRAADVTGFEFGWTPHELVFVARGQAPFALAYGLHGLAPTEFGVEDLLRRQSRPDVADRLVVGQGGLEASRELRGERARAAGWSPADWKRWMLWTVLLLGVAALAVVAARLVRQVNQAP